MLGFASRKINAWAQLGGFSNFTWRNLQLPFLCNVRVIAWNVFLDHSFVIAYDLNRDTWQISCRLHANLFFSHWNGVLAILPFIPPRKLHHPLGRWQRKHDICCFTSVRLHQRGYHLSTWHRSVTRQICKYTLFFCCHALNSAMHDLTTEILIFIESMLGW